MKKLLYIICLLITSSLTHVPLMSSAEDPAMNDVEGSSIKESKEICKDTKENNCSEHQKFAFTFKNGFFYPQECVLRKIFDRCGSKGGYWLELAMRYNFWKGLNVETSGSYFKRDGLALCSNECTEVTIPTIGFGLKYFFNQIDFSDNCNDWKNRCSFFLGGGLRVFFYREKNNSPFVLNCIKKTTAGGMVNAGFEFKLCKNLFLDLFADYNIKKMHLDCGDICCSCNAQSDNFCKPSFVYDMHLGGLVAGIGIGYAF